MIFKTDLANIIYEEIAGLSGFFFFMYDYTYCFIALLLIGVTLNLNKILK